MSSVKTEAALEAEAPATAAGDPASPAIEAAGMEAGDDPGAPTEAPGSDDPVPDVAPDASPEEPEPDEPAAGEPAPGAAGDADGSDETPEAGADEADEGADEVDPAEEARARLRAQAALLSDARVQTVCESLLFVAERPLGEKAIQDATGLEPRRIRAAMEALAGHYREGVSGIVLHEVAGGWQLRTCPTSASFVRRYLQVKPQRLTRAALETLAIVAYRQPVTRPEVEEIRGVDCGAVLKALLDRGLVQVIGKKEEVGRPLLYGTTRAFLEFFNLKDLTSLPTLREFHELNEEHRKAVEDAYPEETAPAANERILDDEDAPRLEEHRAADEAALDELEAALKETELRAQSVSEALGDRPPRGPRAADPVDGAVASRPADAQEETVPAARPDEVEAYDAEDDEDGDDEEEEG